MNVPTAKKQHGAINSCLGKSLSLEEQKKVKAFCLHSYFCKQAQAIIILSN